METKKDSVEHKFSSIVLKCRYSSDTDIFVECYWAILKDALLEAKEIVDE